MITIKAVHRLMFAMMLAWSVGALAEPTCLYVSSYHEGYHWNDGIETGLKRTLSGVCRLRRFYMDTKRNKGAEFAAQKAAEASELIDRIKPDVVIACDDNASKYLVVPYLKETPMPVVFCGVNWTVEPYGYPYANVTGMIEVAPIRALIQEARRLVPNASSLAFVSADVPTQQKDVVRLKKQAAAVGLTLSHALAVDFESWKRNFQWAQAADIVVLGNPAGIKGWDKASADNHIKAHARRLTVSFGVAMSRIAMLAMVNVPEEQGEWSGELAKAILGGSSPAELPITSNRRWHMIVNPGLAEKIGLRMPESLLQGAEIVENDEW